MHDQRTIQSSNWANLGYWSDGQTDYEAACRALASRLISGVRACRRLLIIGVGLGAELLHYADVFSMAEEVVAIEKDRSRLEATRRLLQDCPLDLNITLIHGAFETFESHDRFDLILALDMAYFIAPKSRFFAQVKPLLTPDGVCLYSDVLADIAPLSLFMRLKLAAYLKLMGLSPSDLRSAADYETMALSWGLTCRSADVTEEVIDGFVGFVERASRSQELPSDLAGASGSKFRVTARLLAWLRRHRLVSYHIICVSLHKNTDQPAQF